MLDAGADPDEARALLTAIPGIGPWTAGYVAMRALGDPDVFLPGDVGIRHALSRLGGHAGRRALASLALLRRDASLAHAQWRARGACERTFSRLRYSRAMRAVQIVDLTGPESALAEADVPEPEPSHCSRRAAASSWTFTRPASRSRRCSRRAGEYQVKPPLPFVPGSEVAGVVRSAPEGSAAASEGDRVAACCMLGAFAEVAVAPDFLTFPLSDELDFAQGAGLILNYHTAYFSLKHRGRLAEGETVLVHGAAGGVGTATLQIAKGLGARTIAVVSSDEKERVAREAGADEVVRSDGAWKDEAKELSGGGVDIVIDPVGGDRFTDSLRSLREGGRVVVVGFTGGSIPEVQGQPPAAQQHRGRGRRLGRVRDGQARRQPRDRRRGRPAGRRGLRQARSSGARFPLDRAREALELIDGRGATGKVVLELR